MSLEEDSSFAASSIATSNTPSVQVPSAVSATTSTTSIVAKTLSPATTAMIISASSSYASSSSSSSSSSSVIEHADDESYGHGGGDSSTLGAGRVEVAVSDPTKVGDGMSAYTVFKVTTKVFSSSVRVFVVQRRYSDFEWLHVQLSSSFAGIIIPPLPEKSYIGRFSAEFVESRQRGLEKFLTRVLNHKLLAKCKDLPTFVLADERNLESAKLASKEVEVQKSKGLFDYFSDLSATLSSSFATQPGRPRSVDDVTCDDISAYATSLGSTLQAADVNTDKLLTQSKALASAWFEFGLAFTMLGTFECEQKDAALGNAFQKLGHTADRLSVLYNQKAGKEATMFHEPIRDYLRLVDAIKNMMVTRNAAAERASKAHDNLQAKLARAAALKEYASGVAKMAAADQEIKEAEQALTAETDTLQKVTRRVVVEINNFRKIKGVEFKQFILDFIHMQMEYAQKVRIAWESILGEVESMPV